MSQIPPPPPPLISNSQDDSPQNFVSSCQHFHLDKDALINEIIGLGIQQLPESDKESKDATDKQGILMISSILQPVLQNGPICGLAALAMVSQEVQPGQGQGIFEQARRMGFTKRGEMFSAENMACLAEKILGCSVKIIDTQEIGDDELTELITTNCLVGNFFLVPYDADKNHRPGSFKGHRAHWCVVTGFAVVTSLQKINPQLPDDDAMFFEPRTLTSDQKEVITTHIRGSGAKSNEIYVFTRQSKSKHIGLWKLGDLNDSNRNLAEIAPKILAESEEYVLNSIDKTLRAKIVLVSRSENQK